MPKSKKPEEKPEEQFERFKKVAEEHGVSVKDADEAFKRLSTREHKK